MGYEFVKVKRKFNTYKCKECKNITFFKMLKCHFCNSEVERMKRNYIGKTRKSNLKHHPTWEVI